MTVVLRQLGTTSPHISIGVMPPSTATVTAPPTRLYEAQPQPSIFLSSIVTSDPVIVTPSPTPVSWYSPKLIAAPLVQPNIQQNEFSFLVVSLKRGDLTTSWGMSLTMNGNGLVLVTSFPTTPTYMKHGVWTTPAHAVTTLSPRQWFKEVRAKEGFVNSLTQQVMDVHSHRQNIQYSHQCVLPGDILLAVNGSSVPSKYSTLKDLTNFIRSQQQLLLLVARYEPAVKIATHTLYAASQRGAHHSRSLDASRAAVSVLKPILLPPTVATAPTPSTHYHQKPKALWPPRIIFPQEQDHRILRNPLFQDELTGQYLPYCDNREDSDLIPGHDVSLFLNPLCKKDFNWWLRVRKQPWKANRKTKPFFSPSFRIPIMAKSSTTSSTGPDYFYDLELLERLSSCVPVDFWTPQGFTSFTHWLDSSKKKWKRHYWGRRQRDQLVQDYEQRIILHYNPEDCTSTNWCEWLRIRKNQWRVRRRQFQRKRATTCSAEMIYGKGDAIGIEQLSESAGEASDEKRAIAGEKVVSIEPEILAIDFLLESKAHEERLRQQRRTAQMFDLVEFFRSTTPDDILLHAFSFLDRLEYGKLRCINGEIRESLSNRQELWWTICPVHWTLPRRPRKPWCEIYLSMLRSEVELSRKGGDDILAKSNTLLLKGDHVQSVERLVNEGERKFRFDVNYTSGIVCERNSLLNLAVIHQRLKIVRWLVEVKHADIETFDRGNFTPLLNAAYSGNRSMVRFLLQQGADRAKVGRFHYTKPLSAPDFTGLTAHGWAKKNGHTDVATLIRLGL